MNRITVSPDSIVYWSAGFVNVNATLVFSWVVMVILVVGSALVTRKLTRGVEIGKAQNLLETIVSYMRAQVRQMTNQDPDPYLPFLGTLFLYISLSSLLAVVPGFQPPTGSMATAAALAVCVFFAVPIFGIAKKGVVGYLRHYIRPTPLMLPFNIISEFSRTLALAVRLFGNVMSGSMIVAVLVSIVPLFIPIVMQVLSLLIGQIQAYIFSALATIYVASAVAIGEEADRKRDSKRKEEKHE